MRSEYESLSFRIVDAIIADLSDRRGLRQEWDQIDLDIKQEIHSTWVDIVQKALASGATP